MTTIYNATGRRKSSVARVFLTAGNGEIKVNNRKLKDFFPREAYLEHIQEVLRVTETSAKFDINCYVKGGGTTGQAGSIRLGISRALLQAEPDLAAVLKRGKFLTRDAREVERKKYGQRGARAKFQYSKR